MLGEDHFCPIHPGLDIPKSKQGSFHFMLPWDRDFPANPLFCLLPRFPLFNSRLVNLGKENNTNPQELIDRGTIELQTHSAVLGMNYG